MPQCDFSAVLTCLRPALALSSLPACHRALALILCNIVDCVGMFHAGQSSLLQRRGALTKQSGN